MDEKHSFWSTVPGMLTGIAAVITAIGGLLVVLSQTDILGGNKGKEATRREMAIESKKPLSGQSPKEADTALKGSNTHTADNLGPSVTASGAERINLLSSENGGQILAATSDQWLQTIDGMESNFAFYESNLRGKTEAVYAFKDERPAVFDTFTVLILDTQAGNLKEFELLWGNESATGKFNLIKRFQTENMKLFKTPYQEFKFPPVTAKYLKVRLLSTWEYALIDAREFQLWGTLQ